MKTGLRLIVPSDGLEKPGIEPATLVYKASYITTAPLRLFLDNWVAAYREIAAHSLAICFLSNSTLVLKFYSHLDFLEWGFLSNCTIS